MIALADLDSAAGLEKWLTICRKAGACGSSRNHSRAGIKAGATLRTSIEAMDDEWGPWAIDTFADQMAPDFRLWMLQRYVRDPGQARRLWLTLDCTPDEKAWLKSQCEGAA